MHIEQPHTFMQLAVEQAKAAASRGEVPVGAVLVKNGAVVAASHNLVEANFDATEHAEMRVIRSASHAQKNWRLDECSLFVTLEPCPMCMGALLLARVPEVYFGCFDPRQGACGSVFDLSGIAALPAQTVVFPNLLENECRQLLTDFFSAKR